MSISTLHKGEDDDDDDNDNNNNNNKCCKDQLMISKAIYEDSRRRNKNLSIAWIDYQKVFDSVPHSCVEKSIALVGVNSKIFRFCKLSMEKWNTRLILKTKQEVMQSQPIQIRRGIFRRYSFASHSFH